MIPAPHVKVRCTKCETGTVSVSLGKDPATAQCPACGHVYGKTSEILNFLPPEITQKETKDAEQSGWDALAQHKSDEYLFALPYIRNSKFPDDPYYDLSALHLNVARRVFGSLEGKTMIDLGGSIGWGAYRFARDGARVMLLDYNDSQSSGMGVAERYFKKVGSFPRLRVDAENIPLHDRQVDFVYSCSFIHHMTDPKKLAAEVGRVLKRGGVYVAACEAFLPIGKQPEEYTTGNETVRAFLSKGINEQIFGQKEYLDWFRGAGLEPSLVNPRWDRVSQSGRISYGTKLRKAYRPESLTNRLEGNGVSSTIAKMLLNTGAWKIPVPLLQNRFLHDQLLAVTAKPRVIIGRKR